MIKTKPWLAGFPPAAHSLHSGNARSHCVTGAGRRGASPMLAAHARRPSAATLGTGPEASKTRQRPQSAA